MDSFIRIHRAIDNDIPALQELAKDDGHVIIAPTHVVCKSSYPIGYIGQVPATLIWLNTKEAHVRDSIAVLNHVENGFTANLPRGTSLLHALPCTLNSPFHPFLKDANRSGYFSGGQVELFFKELKA